MESAPQGTNLHGSHGGARTGRVTGTRSKLCRSIGKGIFAKMPELNLNIDPVAAAEKVLNSETYNKDSWAYSDLQEKLSKLLFPSTFRPTGSMLRGIAAEAALLPSKPVLEAMKQKYVNSTKFNAPGLPVRLLPDGDILKLNLGIRISRDHQILAGSLDGTFNEDCVIEFKNGINFNLDDPVAVHKGKIIPIFDVLLSYLRR